MTKSVLIVIIYLLFCSYISSAQKAKTIAFKIKINENSSIILSKKIKDNFIPFDTIKLEAGENVIRKKYKFFEISFILLKIDKKPGFCQFIFDGNLIIQGNADTIWKSKIIGSKSTDEWTLYNKKFVARNKEKIVELSNKINKLIFPADSIEIRKLYYAQSIIMKQSYIDAKEFIKKNKKSFNSLLLLDYIYNEIDVNENILDLKSLSKDLQNNSIGKFIEEKIMLDLQFNKGKKIPKFLLKDLLGDKISSKELLDQVTLLDFWGTWCGPCIKSIPKLKELYKIYNDKNVKFISMANETNLDPKVFLPLIKKEEIGWKTYVQSLNDKSHNSLSTLLNVQIYPTFILIGKDGIILERASGENGIEIMENFLKNYYK